MLEPLLAYAAPCQGPVCQGASWDLQQPPLSKQHPPWSNCAAALSIHFLLPSFEADRTTAWAINISPA
jgi:hypothetical protein